MDNLLIINAHPKIESKTSFTLQVLSHFLNCYKNEDPHKNIEQINLFSEAVPAVDQTVLSAWEKMGSGGDISEDERKVTGRMWEILNQFKNAKEYVIALPLYNFNIPSKLKDYMDNILIARETFQYTENGAKGLLTDGRKMLVIQGSGGVYTNNDWYTDVEFSHKYLKAMCHFMGIEDYQIIRVQGTSIGDRDQILQKAYKEAEEAAVRLSAERVI